MGYEMNNADRLYKGQNILREWFAAYLANELSSVFKDEWWNRVLYVLNDQARDLPESGEYGALVDALDLANCIRLLDRLWNEIFFNKFKAKYQGRAKNYRTYANELMGIRNDISHLGGDEPEDNYTYRALDTMCLLCAAFDEEAAEELRALQDELLPRLARASSKGSANNALPSSQFSEILHDTELGLPSWREIIEPHPDVAKGLYKKAEFAADLNQAANNEGAPEYRDPYEFFSRTFITKDMSGLLVQALKRVNGLDGDPVIQLKTAFGGGKTHTMLALYHMLNGKAPADKLPGVKACMEKAGIEHLPKVNVAVLVGTALDPSKSRRPANLPGVTVNTIWGLLAFQLAVSADMPSIYDFVKEADKKGVSPGSEALRNMFDACGPCLVLMDELVAYAKKLYGVSNLPAGTFDNFITFIQEITEAARASKNSLVVASIPESDIEIGEGAGRMALKAIEHTFGRMESIWKPVGADEGFEVVRRRLFMPCKDTAQRDYVCGRFSNMYVDNSQDFPPETRELEYKKRLEACYPIHPEVFDRLYEDWATLEKFQRTRGVLRLMAAVIHELWMGQDQSPMIMPGSLPLSNSGVRDELTRYLSSEGWNSIVDHEVDGKKSIPYIIEKENKRYGKRMAARRVARTIMLGSAPTERGQAVRGIENSRVRLGIVMPGENVADFNDALTALQNRLAYLYANATASRFWFDTRPTLRKTVDDRASQVAKQDAEAEIERRLGKLRRHELFGGLHICPGSSLDVPDDQTARLVILPLDCAYAKKIEPNQALTACEDFLNNRGTSPRLYRNMLAFVAPDADLSESLLQAVRQYLAWQSIEQDKESLNLDAAQNKETKNNIARSSETVDLRINETFRWLLVPSSDRDNASHAIEWQALHMTGNNGSIVEKAADAMRRDGTLIDIWAPKLLLMELDNLLWKDKDSLSLKDLWDYLCSYCYLPRLTNYSVLEDAVKQGVCSNEFFALADGVSEGRFIGLKVNEPVAGADKSKYLVKLPVALRQLEEDKQKEQAAKLSPGGGTVAYNGVAGSASCGIGDGAHDGAGVSSVVRDNRNEAYSPSTAPAEPAAPLPKRFFMSVELDNVRVVRDVGQMWEEVIKHINNTGSCNLKLSLEVDASAPAGFPKDVVRTVTENCRSLKVSNFGFEE